MCWENGKLLALIQLLVIQPAEINFNVWAQCNLVFTLSAMSYVNDQLPSTTHTYMLVCEKFPLRMQRCLLFGWRNWIVVSNKVSNVRWPRFGKCCRRVNLRSTYTLKHGTAEPDSGFYYTCAKLRQLAKASHTLYIAHV